MESVKKILTKLYLPKNGQKTWSAIMQGEAIISEELYENQPLVMAIARFTDGKTVLAGVLKSKEPKTYNIKFMSLYDTDGNFMQPIDVSDHEDFHSSSISFIVGDDESVEYIIKIVEKD